MILLFNTRARDFHNDSKIDIKNTLFNTTYISIVENTRRETKKSCKISLDWRTTHIVVKSAG